MTERALWGAAGAARILRYMAAGAGTLCELGQFAWIPTAKPISGRASRGPTFMLQNAEEPSVIRRLPEYYWLSLLGRSIRPGDRLLSCESKEVEAAAFLSSDGKKKKVLLVNTGTQEKVEAVRYGRPFGTDFASCPACRGVVGGRINAYDRPGYNLVED